MRVVLDINSFLVSISKKSKYRPVFDNFLQEKFSLIISNEILMEYEEIIGQKMNETIASNVIELLMLAPNIEKTEIYTIGTLLKLMLMTISMPIVQ